MKIAHRVSQLSPSMTLALTARAKALKAQGKDVLSFGVGEPDFDTPDFIKEVAIEDLRAGRTKYTAAEGAPELLDAIIGYLASRYALKYSRNEIIVSCGGKHSLYNAFMTLVDPGDEVIIPSPYWLSYPEQVLAADGKPVVVTCGPEAGFKISPAQLDAAITPRTVAFILNSPSNPTGAVYSREELLAIGEVLLRHPHVVLISDDLYERLVYDGAEFHSLVSLLPELRSRTLVVNGLSKAYSMTGWRMGWAAGPKELVQPMVNLQSHSTSNVTTFCQRASAEALKSDHAFLGPWRAEFDARRRLIVDGLNAIPGVSCAPPPMGAFYAFPDVSRTYSRTFGGREVRNSMDFAAAALDSVGVALVPGVVFGEDRCVRLSYATSQDVIRDGLQRLRGMLE